jgi:hypothetical protein
LLLETLTNNPLKIMKTQKITLINQELKDEFARVGSLKPEEKIWSLK